LSPITSKIDSMKRLKYFHSFFIIVFKSGVIPESEIRKSEAAFSWFRNLFFVFVYAEKLQTMHLILGNVSIPVLCWVICSNHSPNQNIAN
jgi:hypothetical protein